MSGNRSVSPQDKLSAVKEYLDGTGSTYYIADKYKVDQSTFREWLAKYKIYGEEAFIIARKNASYSESFKKRVVKAYLNGEGSLRDIAIRFKIPGHHAVMRWVSKYNGHEELKTHKTGGNPIMTKGRKTTYDERIEIVTYCIEHQNNYDKTALKYKVSYQQVYGWCKKYEKSGVEALQDRRGRRKPTSEMSEIERLRDENRLLRADNKRKDLENLFLKKLEEIERRGY